MLIFDSRLRQFEEVKAQRDYSSEYKFTNPILDYENVKMEETGLGIEKMKYGINKLQEKYGLAFVSVYFRDLDNGQWIGFNEKERFASASLVKLPVLIALLKQSEAEPGLLDKLVTVSPEDVSAAGTQDIPPAHPLKAGETLTLLEAAKRMIQESDNVAMKAVEKNIAEKYRNGIFKAIGVEFDVENEDVMVRVKDYAGFFRVLFNASYLSRESSELALEILSQVDFDKGLVAGVPRNLTVSHKFGERSYYLDDIPSARQLHDCGIVYFPQKPYILCVMTRGHDYDEQSAFIREVSKLFYAELSKNF